MENKIKVILENAKQDVLACNSLKELYDVKVKYLGKSGEVTELSKGMRDVPKEDRPMVGKLVNELRNSIDEVLLARETVLKEIETQKAFEKEAIDITLPAKTQNKGALHPITLIKNELIDAFIGMGFEVFEGPEIEED